MLALLFGAIAITGLAAIAGIVARGGEGARCCTPDLDAFQQGPADMVGR